MSKVWPDPVPGAPYTSRSLAQLALAVAAREASDYARSMLPTGPRHAAYDGTLLAGAVRLRDLAERVLELAVVVEREDGTEWEEIDEQLGPDAGVRVFEQRWHEQVGRAAMPGCADDDLPEVLLEDPASVAQRLDEWVLRHREPLDPIDGEHPVTDTLEAMHPMLELMHLRNLQRRLEQDYLDPPVDPLAALFEREALVHEALGASGDTTGDHAADAVRARARAAELRNRAGPNGQQTPWGPRSAD